MKRNDSRAIARLKRMYRVFKDNLFIKDGKKWRPCESITEFLELRWVKKLKNTVRIERQPLDKLDAKQKNRKRATRRNEEGQCTNLLKTEVDIQCLLQQKEIFHFYRCLLFWNNCTNLFQKLYNFRHSRSIRTWAKH